MQISASLNVDDRRVLARSTDAKPDAADGMDERIGELTVHLSAHAPDIDVNDVGRWIEVKIPDMLQQHCPGDNLAFVADKILQDLKFARQQLDFLGTPGHRSRYEVELEVADTQHGLL